MSIFSLRKSLRNKLHEGWGEYLPRTHADDFKYFIMGLFNDIYDETGFPAFGLKTVATRDGGAGEVSFGWDEEGKMVGLKLIAHSTPEYLDIFIVPIKNEEVGYLSNSEDLDGYPGISLEPDGSDYNERLREIVDFIRLNMR